MSKMDHLSYTRVLALKAITVGLIFLVINHLVAQGGRWYYPSLLICGCIAFSFGLAMLVFPGAAIYKEQIPEGIKPFRYVWDTTSKNIRLFWFLAGSSGFIIGVILDAKFGGSLFDIIF